MTDAAGKVFLVGAGPGDLGLVTLRAQQLVQQCDVLVYDYLANPSMLTWCQTGCETIYVGKEAGRHSMPQEDIQALLVAKAMEGKQVVRLKGGDPFIFGRGGEEVAQLLENGLDFEVVPGVSAALAASAYVGVPLTHRDFSSSVSFLTGHENPEKENFRVDFERFAQCGDTLCIYMGMLRLPDIVGKLLAGGLAEDTAVVVVQWASMPQQRSVAGSLGTIVDVVEEAGLRPPAVVIVGEVARCYPDMNWFEKKALWGKRVVVTRNREKSGNLSRLLMAAGAEVLELPLIEVTAHADPTNLADVWSEIARYEWIVFTSPNGVEHFFHYFYEKYEDLRCLGPMRIACVGESTAKAVRAHRLQVDVIPGEANAEALADALMAEDNIENLQVLVVQGNLNDPVLVEKLTTEGRAMVDTLPVYRTQKADLTGSAVVKDFREKGADVVLFTSSSSVQSFVDQAEHLGLQSEAQRPVLASIGPKTTQVLKEKGLLVDIQAKQASLDELVEAVRVYFNEKS